MNADAVIQAFSVQFRFTKGFRFPKYRIICLQRNSPSWPLYARRGLYLPLLDASVSAKTETYGDGFIHHKHMAVIQTSHVLPQPLFIYGTDLLQ